MRDILIAAIAGAVIGYSTNWLAIKMLFRPHREIHVFGIHLPFTPGLIPKERYSIAKKLGETISKNLMNTEILVEAISSGDAAKNFGTLIDGLLEKIRTSHSTPGTLLMELSGWDSQELSDRINSAAETLSAAVIMNPSLRHKLKAASTRHTLHFLKGGGLGEVVQALRENMAGQRLGQYLSEKDLSAVKKIVETKTPELMLRIQQYLIFNDAVDLKLKPLVHKVIDDNVSGLAGLFINRDKVYQSLRDGIIDYLGDEASQTTIIEMLSAQLDKLSERDIGELAGELFEKLPRGIWEGLPNGIEAPEDLDHRLEQGISKLLDKLLDGEFSDFSSGMVKKLLFSVAHMEIGDLAKKIQSGNSFDIKTHTLKIISILMEKYSHYLFDSIDFSAIIEKQINTFGVQEAEDIIMSVVKRELNAITNLGGLLGFIIGLVATLI